MTFAMSAHAWAAQQAAPNALVYKGPGACDEDCSAAAALMAQMAGLNPVYVGPAETDPKLFDNAVVWIQPGGESRTVGRNMTAELKQRIRDFVRGGGAYVGFCAGGFYATARIGELSDAGLGLITGTSKLFEGIDQDAGITALNWGGKTRDLYWEGGPSFYAPTDGSPGPEVVATYPDHTAAAVRAAYGAGRVFVSGVHPEAPQWWRDYYKLSDGDGLDYDLAVGMIRWAARLP
jgi:glutamine amidotransferase-like uncharacterized protein